MAAPLHVSERDAAERAVPDGVEHAGIAERPGIAPALKKKFFVVDARRTMEEDRAAGKIVVVT